MKTWHSYYQERPEDVSNILLHWQYLLRIILLRPKRLLEIGCGRAQHSLFIKRLQPKILLFLADKDKILLQKVTINQKNKIVIDVLDGRKVKKIPYTDLVISQGLIEHFTEKQIKNLIENFQGKTARMIASVPSINYPTLDFGNEMLRTKEEYKIILEKIQGIKFFITDYLDLGWRTKLVGVKIKKLDLFKALEYIFFRSNHFLIEIKYL